MGNPPCGSMESKGVDAASGKEKERPFVPSEGLPPVPAKLVAKIIRREFVDVSELLRDNVEALRWRGGGEIPTTGSLMKATRREVSRRCGGLG